MGVPETAVRLTFGLNERLGGLRVRCKWFDCGTREWATVTTSNRGAGKRAGFPGRGANECGGQWRAAQEVWLWGAVVWLWSQVSADGAAPTVGWELGVQPERAATNAQRRLLAAISGLRQTHQCARDVGNNSKMRGPPNV